MIENAPTMKDKRHLLAAWIDNERTRNMEV
jgi:hypothetical protein